MEAGARNVRVIKRALSALDPAQQSALILQDHAATAAALGCSVRSLAYLLLAARRPADTLDRLVLL